MTQSRRKTTERGYNAAYQRERKKHDREVKAGRAACWRCGQPIPADGPWDLGHDDDDRSIIRGPEHVKCNRSAGARKSNAGRAKAKSEPRSPRSRVW